jgi:hypothetical protein
MDHAVSTEFFGNSSSSESHLDTSATLADDERSPQTPVARRILKSSDDPIPMLKSVEIKEPTTQSNSSLQRTDTMTTNGVRGDCGCCRFKIKLIRGLILLAVSGIAGVVIIRDPANCNSASPSFGVLGAVLGLLMPSAMQ